MTETAAPDYRGPLEQGVATIVVQTLDGAASVERLVGLCDAAFAFADGMMADMRGKEPPPQPLACAAGCAYCCIGTTVEVTAPEAVRLAEALTQLDDDTVAAILIRAQHVSRLKQQVAAGEAAPELPGGFVCPLLRDGRCAVYPVRPLVCRGFNSYDARVCERRKVEGDADADIRGYGHDHVVAASVLAGIRRGLTEAGLAAPVLDLAPALWIAASEPRAAERWLAGEPVFAAAEIAAPSA